MSPHQRSGIWFRIAFTLASLGTAALTLDAHAQDIERGRALYENHCQVCHKVDIHGRKGRAAIGVSELREIVERWQTNQKLRWTSQEIDDVVYFLSTTRYFFTTSVEQDPLQRGAAPR